MNQTQGKFQNRILLLLVTIFVIGCTSEASKNIHDSNEERSGNLKIGGSITPDQDYVVIEGKGIKSVQIGMSRKQLLKHLGQPADEYVHNGKCNYSELHWFPPTASDGTVSGDGIFAFLKEDHVFELRFGKGYQTKAGIGFGSSFDIVRNLAGAITYELVPSANTATNNRNLIYTVIVPDGVAFELGSDARTGLRIVNGIYVFEPGAGFLPWGCLDENQRLVQLDKS